MTSKALSFPAKLQAAFIFHRLLIAKCLDGSLSDTNQGGITHFDRNASIPVFFSLAYQELPSITATSRSNYLMVGTQVNDNLTGFQLISNTDTSVYVSWIAAGR